jgi:hypothetical protein
MFWAGRDDPDEIRALGVRCGQLGIGPGIAMRPLSLEGFTIVTLFAAFAGESYADLPTVLETVGFVPPSTRAEREARMYELSDFAARLHVPAIACHIGCIPDAVSALDYIAVRDLVRRICDYAAARNFHSRPDRKPPTPCCNSYTTWNVRTCGSTSIRRT